MEKYEHIKTMPVDSSACNSYIARVLEEEAVKTELEKRVNDEFLNRFNGSEQTNHIEH